MLAALPDSGGARTRRQKLRSILRGNHYAWRGQMEAQKWVAAHSDWNVEKSSRHPYGKNLASLGLTFSARHGKPSA